jgi:hypothetical protein
VELDLRIGLRGRVDLAGASAQVVGLGLRVVELRGGRVGVDREQGDGQEGEDAHGVASLDARP